MRSMFLIFTCCFSVSFSFSQRVGIGTSTPHASAQLDISSTSRGLLVPRVTSAQRIAITNPATGLMVYQTDSSSAATPKGFYVYDGIAWNEMAKRESIYAGGAWKQGSLSSGIYTDKSVSIGATGGMYKFAVNGSMTVGAIFSSGPIAIETTPVGLLRAVFEINGTTESLKTMIVNDDPPTIELQSSGVEKGFIQLSGDNLRLGTYSSNDAGRVIFRLNGSDRFTVLPNGNATLTGTLTQNSDARFKTAISKIENALGKVMQLNGYQYYWKKELKNDSSLQIGLIAQNVETVLPQLVAKDAEGNRSVAYQNMVPVLIEAIKEQQQLIMQMKEEIADLQKKNGR